MGVAAEAEAHELGEVDQDPLAIGLRSDALADPAAHLADLRRGRLLVEEIERAAQHAAEHAERLVLAHGIPAAHEHQRRGIAIARAWSGDRAWAYTLYNGGTSHAFVHALNTRTRVARCIDLPWAGNAQSVLEGAALSVNGRTLTLADGGGRVLARIDTRTFSVQA